MLKATEVDEATVSARVAGADYGLNVHFWPIASFRYAAEFGRYRGIADINQAAPITLDL
jgi:hypothetical protein